MPTISRLLLAAALGVMTVFEGTQAQAAMANDSDPSARILAAQRRLESFASGADAKSTNVTGSAVPAPPGANPYRLYPPSCLGYPLPDAPSGPTFSRTVNLSAYDRDADTYQLEEVTILVWRVACSSSAFPASATLMRIQRQPEAEDAGHVLLLFPLVEAAAVDFDFSQDEFFFGAGYPRTAIEPNTVSSWSWPGTLIRFSETYVLEGVALPTAVRWNFNEVFALSFDNLATGGITDRFGLVIPAYNPTSGTYPAAFQNLPISGYMSTNWFDPAANGEGIVLQIYEPVGDTQNLVVSFTWAAYDPSGIPFWLSGQATIARGAKTASATMFYRTGGGLGGNGGSAGAPIAWGTATVSFPDCNRMILSYASNPGQPSGIPTGNGTRTWQRIANVNALACE